MKNIVLALLSAVLAHALVTGAEMCAGITIEFVPRVLICIPLTLMIEFPMLAVVGRK